MFTINTYLNFDGTTEAAFNFYKSVFGGEFSAFQRFSEAPGGDQIPAAGRDRIMHVALPLGDGAILMASDIMPSIGHVLKPGNNFYISLNPDNRAEADRLFAALSVNGKVEMALAEMFWGAYFGSFTDQFGVQWMINCDAR